MEDNSSSIHPLFWLPSDFLADDDQDKLPTEFPYDFPELTRHSASQEKRGLVGSPQSILSPNGPSSPTAPFSQKTYQSWNLICAAAGEVNMWKMQNENIFTSPSLNKNTPVRQNNGPVWGHPFGVSAEYGCGFSGNAFQIGWPASQLQIQHFNANGSVSHRTFQFSGGRSNIAGGGVGLKRKCAGTGVFLPRTCPDPTASKVKLGCPASFTPPTSPAQALNVNYNHNVTSQAKAQPPFTSGVTSHHDAMLVGRNAVLAQQWRNGMNTVGNGALNCDQFLPLEWSY